MQNSIGNTGCSHYLVHNFFNGQLVDKSMKIMILIWYTQRRLDFMVVLRQCRNLSDLLYCMSKKSWPIQYSKGSCNFFCGPASKALGANFFSAFFSRASKRVLFSYWPSPLLEAGRLPYRERNKGKIINDPYIAAGFPVAEEPLCWTWSTPPPSSASDTTRLEHTVLSVCLIV